MKPQPTIIIPIVEYDRLVAIEEAFEDMQAKAAYDATRDEESIPAAVVNRLIDGDFPLRVWRNHRGLTLKDLAVSVDISLTYLSEIETGKKHGSLRVWKLLAEKLNVDLDDLV